MNLVRKGYLFAVASVILWASSATAFKLGLKELNYMQLLAFASYTSLVILFFMLLWQGQTKEVLQQSVDVYLKSSFLGFLNPFGYYLVLFKAYSLIPAQIAQPLNFIWPIVLVLLSVFILKQKITKFNIFGLLMSFVGVMVISVQGNISLVKIESFPGILLAAGSSVIWALYWIFNMNRTIDEVLGLFLNFLFSSVYITFLLILTGNFELPVIKGLAAAIYVGSFEMGFTFIFWLKALNYSGSASKVGNLIYLTPFLSLILIHFVLKESIYGTTFLGLILIISGLVVNQLKPKLKVENITAA